MKMFSVWVYNQFSIWLSVSRNCASCSLRNQDATCLRKLVSSMEIKRDFYSFYLFIIHIAVNSYYKQK